MSPFVARYETMNLEDFEDLLADRPADEQWELIDRRVVKQTVGARWHHHMVVQNIAFGLRQHLQSWWSECRVFSETFSMKSKRVESATLPDVMVRCGPIPPDAVAFDDPTVLVEVASPGSDERDRTEKWRVYRRLTSLQHYVIVERDAMQIDVYDRTGSAWAGARRIDAPDAVLGLPVIGVDIPLSEIYRDVPAFRA